MPANAKGSADPEHSAMTPTPIAKLLASRWCGVAARAVLTFPYWINPIASILNSRPNFHNPRKPLAILGRRHSDVPSECTPQRIRISKATMRGHLFRSLMPKLK
jgi:hypothetical protein